MTAPTTCKTLPDMMVYDALPPDLDFKLIALLVPKAENRVPESVSA